jgi:pimeloyl-ACP methyl ester carboxylesterase
MRAGWIAPGRTLSIVKEHGVKEVTSQDGTKIAFDQMGQGPAVVLVCGGSVDRMSNAPLAAALADQFTVYNFDRRGRGDSGDTPPYAVEREVEDIAAVIDAAGGSAFLYGISSGAALALEAARLLPSKVKKLALYEPPYIVGDTRPRPPADTARIYNDFVSSGRRGEAAEYFMVQVVGLPPEFAAQARNAPWWPAQEALAHTLAYDATIMGDYSLPADRARAVTTPTAVIAGGATWDWMRTTAQALAAAMPDAEYRVLEGQEHNVDPTVLATALTDFFNS